MTIFSQVYHHARITTLFVAVIVCSHHLVWPSLFVTVTFPGRCCCGRHYLWPSLLNPTAEAWCPFNGKLQGCRGVTNRWRGSQLCFSVCRWH